MTFLQKILPRETSEVARQARLSDCSSRLMFRAEANKARLLGSDFVGSVLDATGQQLACAPRTHSFINAWAGDRSAAALAMRCNGALHALARLGNADRIATLYRREHCDFEGAIAEALTLYDDFIFQWMQHPPQTNEIARSAALVAALLVAKKRFDMPFELLELGSSGGLNLNCAQYSYQLGDIRTGDSHSPVCIRPRWVGISPPAGQPEIVSARGVDRSPLNTKAAETRERLLSFIWADQTERLQRLEKAFDLALANPPAVDRGEATDWLTRRLNTPQADGVCRVVFHSMVLQYFENHEYRITLDAITRAGSKATQRKPFAWIGFEWTADRSEVRLTLTTWPDGQSEVLAICHPYGDWIRWVKSE